MVEHLEKKLVAKPFPGFREDAMIGHFFIQVISNIPAID